MMLRLWQAPLISIQDNNNDASPLASTINDKILAIYRSLAKTKKLNTQLFFGNNRKKMLATFKVCNYGIYPSLLEGPCLPAKP